MTAWDPGVIVVGIDGSEQSLRAADTAAALARKHQARLHLVTVVRPPEGWWGVVGSPPPAEALTNSMAVAQRSILDMSVAATDLAGVDYVADEDIDDPASRLMATCEDLGADLLVVGRRGAGVVERLVLGSVADRLAHNAPCALLIVP